MRYDHNQEPPLSFIDTNLTQVVASNLSSVWGDATLEAYYATTTSSISSEAFFFLGLHILFMRDQILTQQNHSLQKLG